MQGIASRNAEALLVLSVGDYMIPGLAVKRGWDSRAVGLSFYKNRSEPRSKPSEEGLDRHPEKKSLGRHEAPSLRHLILAR